MRIFVTGGAGFIGSATIRLALEDPRHQIINVDKLTYAANLDNLRSIENNRNYVFENADICDSGKMRELFARHDPDVVMHLAAESHVDRSIDSPAAFIDTNIRGTFVLLDAALAHFRSLPADRKAAFRFHHVSTDEVYGSLSEGGYFSETTPYAPNSPYSASKASSDMLVRAWHRTFGLPAVITNCSNNYGPFQFPEKLIPLVILSALHGHPIPIYGSGKNIRDWLHVEDHARALLLVVTNGKIGETYNIGARSERNNLDLGMLLCRTLDEVLPNAPHVPHRNLMQFVADRPGHDARYAIDPTKIERELGWRPTVTLEEGIRKTVQWYLDNRWWWQPIYERGVATTRLGVIQTNGSQTSAESHPPR